MSRCSQQPVQIDAMKILWALLAAGCSAFDADSYRAVRLFTDNSGYPGQPSDALKAIDMAVAFDQKHGLDVVRVPSIEEANTFLSWGEPKPGYSGWTTFGGDNQVTIVLRAQLFSNLKWWLEWDGLEACRAGGYEPDLVGIAAHELGHAARLHHVSDPNDVMHSPQVPCQPQRSLTLPQEERE